MSEGCVMKTFLSIGSGSVISLSRLIAVIGSDGAPVRRLISDARERGTLIDATSGKKTRSVIVMDSDHIILSAFEPAELYGQTEDGDES